MAVAAGETVSEPESGLVPVQLPEAVQLVTLVEDQLRVDVCPWVIIVGVAVKLSAGDGRAKYLNTTLVN